MSEANYERLIKELTQITMELQVSDASVAALLEYPKTLRNRLGGALNISVGRIGPGVTAPALIVRNHRDAFKRMRDLVFPFHPNSYRNGTKLSRETEYFARRVQCGTLIEESSWCIVTGWDLGLLESYTLDQLYTKAESYGLCPATSAGQILAALEAEVISRRSDVNIAVTEDLFRAAPCHRRNKKGKIFPIAKCKTEGGSYSSIHFDGIRFESTADFVGEMKFYPTRENWAFVVR